MVDMIVVQNTSRTALRTGGERGREGGKQSRWRKKSSGAFGGVVAPKVTEPSSQIAHEAEETKAPSATTNKSADRGDSEKMYGEINPWDMDKKMLAGIEGGGGELARHLPNCPSTPTSNLEALRVLRPTEGFDCALSSAAASPADGQLRDPASTASHVATMLLTTLPALIAPNMLT
ncbi:hypothetical protein E4U55_004806 [Claviceps digitariae]|nr:hypothetical protein E4U55_004806 [Claviceps digitariae]